MLRGLLIAVAILAVLIAIVVVVGYLLPKGHVAAREMTLPRAAAEVYGAIVDVERYPAWRSDVRAVQVESSSPLRWREDSRSGKITFEIIDAAAPSRVVVQIADRSLPFGGSWVYDLEPRGESTRVVITERGEVYNPIFRFMSRFFFSQTSTIDGFLRALAARFGVPSPTITDASPSPPRGV